MPGLDGLDPAPHIGPAFRDAFSTWRDLTAFLAAHATTPAFDADRAARQLLMTDLLARFTAVDGFGWVLRGSLALPARPGPRTGSPRAAIAPVYVTARPAFDLDLCATTLTRADPADQTGAGQVLSSVAEQIIDTGGHAWARHGVGLGGLIHYSSSDLRVLRSGRVVAQVTARPLDPRHSSALWLVPADDPLTVHIDLSAPGAALFTGAAERAQRPVLAIAVPGFADIRPDLYPTVNQLADKLALMVTPHWNPPWHRFKDLFDMHYLTTNCQIHAGELRDAIATNTNLTRHGLATLPRPYRLYGHEPRPGEDAVAWEHGYQRLRATHPALTSYPPFAAVLAEIRDVADHLPAGPDSAVWDATDRQWAEPRTGKDRPSRPPPPRPGLRPVAAQLAPPSDLSTPRHDPGRRSR